jgi:WD40 repeat protein
MWEMEMAASEGDAGRVDAWRLLRRWTVGETFAVSCLAVGTGSAATLIAAGYDDGRVVVYDTVSTAVVGSPLPPHTAPVRGVAIATVAGRVVVVSAAADGLRANDLLTGEADEELGTAGAQGAELTAFIALGGLPTPVVAAGYDDGTIHVIDVAAHRLVGSPLPIGRSRVVALASTLHTSEALLLAADEDGSVSLLNPLGGRRVAAPVITGRRVRSVDIDVLGGTPQIMVGTEDGAVIRVDPSGAATPIGKVSGPAVVAATASSVPIVVAGGSDGQLVWFGSAGDPLSVPPTVLSGGLTAVTVDPSEAVVVAGGADGSIVRLDASTGAPIGLPIIGAPERVDAVCMGRAYGADMIVTGSSNGAVRRFQPGGQAIGDRMDVHTLPITSLALVEAGNSSLVVSVDVAGVIAASDASTGATTERFDLAEVSTKPYGGVLAAATATIAGRPEIVASTSDGQFVRYELSAGGKVALSGVGVRETAVAVNSPSETEIIVTGDTEGLVRRLRPATREPLGEPTQAHRATVTALVLGVVDHQATIFSGAVDGTVSATDQTTGELLRALPSPAGGAVTSLELVDVDGRPMLAIGSADGLVTILDAATSAEVTALTGHTGSVTDIAAGTIGDQPVILSASTDGTVAEWLVPVAGATAVANEQYRMHIATLLTSDEQASEDLLGVGPIADALVAFINNPNTTAPLSIAVKGPWGAGKSTLMGLVRDRLDPPATRRHKATHAPTRWELRRRWRERGQRVTAGEVLGSTRGPESKRETKHIHGRLTVWFNPWAYQTGEQVWAGFAHELIEQVTNRMSTVERERFWLRLNMERVDHHAVRRAFYRVGFSLLVKALALVALATAVVALFATSVAWHWVAAVGGVGAVASSAAWMLTRPASSMYKLLVGGSIFDRVRAVGDSVGGLDDYVPDPDYESRTGYVHLIHTDIERVLELSAPVKTPEHPEGIDVPLVVFVDDLDRCTPDVVLQVLEAINLFLAGELHNCIFVLGIEPTMLAAHLANHYKELIASLRERDPSLTHNDISWSFLQKLLQLSVRVPDAKPEDLDKYLDALLRSAVAATPSDGRSGVAGMTGGASSGAGPSSAGADGGPLYPAAPAMGPGDDGTAGAYSSLSRETEEAALRTIASSQVERLLAFDDPRIVEMVLTRARSISTNPRALKRLMNLFIFHSYVAAQRLLLTTDGDAIVEDLAKVLDLAELLVRWPQVADRLARQAPRGTKLEAISAVAPDTTRWATTLSDLELVAKPADAPDPSAETAESLEDLREFLVKHGPSVPLMAQLI